MRPRRPFGSPAASPLYQPAVLTAYGAGDMAWRAAGVRAHHASERFLRAVALAVRSPATQASKLEAALGVRSVFTPLGGGEPIIGYRMPDPSSDPTEG